MFLKSKVKRKSRKIKSSNNRKKSRRVKKKSKKSFSPEPQRCFICGNTEENESNPIIRTDCEHFFHQNCLFNLFRIQHNTNCPQCGNHIRIIEISNRSGILYARLNQVW